MRDPPLDGAAPPTAEEYLRRAAELRTRAASIRSPQVREQLLLMAQDWEKLAQRQTP